MSTPTPPPPSFVSSTTNLDALTIPQLHQRIRNLETELANSQHHARRHILNFKTASEDLQKTVRNQAQAIAALQGMITEAKITTIDALDRLWRELINEAKAAPNATATIVGKCKGSLLKILTPLGHDGSDISQLILYESHCKCCYSTGTNGTMFCKFCGGPLVPGKPPSSPAVPTTNSSMTVPPPPSLTSSSSNPNPSSSPTTINIATPPVSQSSAVPPVPSTTSNVPLTTTSTPAAATPTTNAITNVSKQPSLVFKKTSVQAAAAAATTTTSTTTMTSPGNPFGPPPTIPATNNNSSSSNPSSTTVPLTTSTVPVLHRPGNPFDIPVANSTITSSNNSNPFGTSVSSATTTVSTVAPSFPSTPSASSSTASTTLPPPVKSTNPFDLPSSTTVSSFSTVSSDTKENVKSSPPSSSSSSSLPSTVVPRSSSSNLSTDDTTTTTTTMAATVKNEPIVSKSIPSTVASTNPFGEATVAIPVSKNPFDIPPIESKKHNSFSLPISPSPNNNNNADDLFTVPDKTRTTSISSSLFTDTSLLKPDDGNLFSIPSSSIFATTTATTTSNDTTDDKSVTVDVSTSISPPVNEPSTEPSTDIPTIFTRSDNNIYDTPSTDTSASSTAHTNTHQTNTLDDEYSTLSVSQLAKKLKALGVVYDKREIVEKSDLLRVLRQHLAQNTDGTKTNGEPSEGSSSSSSSAPTVSVSSSTEDAKDTINEPSFTDSNSTSSSPVKEAATAVSSSSSASVSVEPVLSRPSSFVASSNEPLKISSSSSSIASSPLPAEPLPLPEGWKEVLTDDGKKYYYHELSRVSRWDRPDSETAVRIAERLESQAAEAARRQAERLASLSAAEAALAAERAEAAEHKVRIREHIEEWCAAAGWSGIKAVRRAAKVAQATAQAAAQSNNPSEQSTANATLETALSWPKRSLIALLASVHTLQGLETIIEKDKPIITLPSKDWSWDGLQGRSVQMTNDNDLETIIQCALQASSGITDSMLKKGYLQAVRILHPDKTSSYTLLARMCAESAFTVIGTVWEAINEIKAGTLLTSTVTTPTTNTTEDI